MAGVLTIIIPLKLYLPGHYFMTVARENGVGVRAGGAKKGNGVATNMDFII